MTDRREEIIWPILKKPEYCADDNIPIAAIKEMMDEYMKECALGFLKYTLEKMGGHSVDAAGNVEVKFNGEWITPEQLFENFL